MGGNKNDAAEGKPDMSLLPLDILAHVARPYEYGLIKYGRNNWRKGFDTNRSIAAALRHISAWQDKGEDYDQEALEKGVEMHHISCAIFNLLCVLDAIHNHPELVNNYKRGE